MTRLSPRQFLARVSGILVVMLAFAFGDAHATWMWQNPMPQGNQLTDVAFIDGNTGFAVGANGLMMRTNDRGMTWTMISTGMTTNLNRVVFASKDSGWVFGDNGLAVWTKNGGATWNVQTTGTTNNLYDAQFIDHLNGFAVGAAGTILRTTNAGIKWEMLTSGTTVSLRGLSFLDARNGWVVGFGGTILSTIDFGDSWTSHAGVSSSVNLYAAWFSSMTTGWVGGDYGTVTHTRDGGQTWLYDRVASGERVNRFLDAPGVAKIGVCNSGIVVSALENDSLWNGSQQNYTKLNLNGGNVVRDTGATKYRTRFVGDKGVILSCDGFASLPVNLGSSAWSTLAAGTRTNLYAMYFTGMTAGYAAGDSGIVFRTNDGMNWWPMVAYPGGLFRGIAFNPGDQANGILVGLGGLVCWTNDAGQTWKKDTASILKNLDLFAVSFSSVGTCYVVGAAGTVLQYSAGTWTKMTAPSTRNLFGIHMADRFYGTAVGQAGVAYKTKDGGSTWTSMNTGTTQDLYNVQMFHGNTTWTGSDSLEASNGYIVGNTGVVRRTTNGGQNWLTVNMGQASGGAFRGLKFVKALEGLVVGPGGAIYSTIDGGATWTNQPTPTKSNLNAVWVVTENEAWAVGENGTTLHNDAIGLPVEVASFEGWQEGSGAQLAWTTAGELNNARFEIERRTASSDWRTIGAIAGSGTTSDRHQYRFADANLSPNTYTYRLKQVDNSGAYHLGATEVEVTIAAPTAVALFQNYPNPFNPSTRISYDLKSASNVTLEVFSMAGEHVATVVNGGQEAGHHVATFDASLLPTGTYEYRLNANGMTFSRLMTLLK